MLPVAEPPTRFEFYRQRDFGDTVSATFTFLRQEFVPFGKNLVYIVGPLLILAAIVDLFFQAPPTEVLTGAFWSGLALLFLISMLVYIVIVLIVNHYIRLYIANDESRFNPGAMLGYCAESFLRITGVAFLLTVAVVLASVLFIIPGVYLSISSCLILTAAIQEDLSFSDAWKRSTHLIKDYWWYTFWLIFIISIITYIFYMLLFLPTFVVTFLTRIHGEYAGIDLFWVKAAQAVGHLSSFFYVIPLVALTIHFFSQLEKKEAAGLQRKVASLDALAGE